MFLRVVRAAGGKGIKHEYVRVAEAYRERGKTRHRTVLNLGRRDLLAAHLDLNRLMRLARACCMPKKPNRRSAAGSNPGEGAGAGFHFLRGAPRTQYHSGAQ
jgi:hypothetical protein